MDTLKPINKNDDSDVRQKIIVVCRDKNNKYGVSITGHNPVSIKAVRKGCPADIAGLKAGDMIIKVDGKLVIAASHETVTDMMKAANQVTLTLAERDDTTIDCSSLLKPKSEKTAAFLRYLIANEKPNALLFLLMSEAYRQKPGKVKDKKRWLYEISTAFLVPTAPLEISVEPQIIYNIVNVIQNESIRDDQVFSNIFLAAREPAKSVVMEKFTEYKKTRPNLIDKSKSDDIKAAEGILTPQLNRLMEDIEAFRQVSQSTLDVHILPDIFKSANSALGRCPAFLQKDRSGTGPNEECFIKGHRFQPQAFTTIKYCGQCNRVIWGIGKNAYHCQACGFNVHISACAKSLLYSCQGSSARKPIKTASNKRTSWWNFSGNTADKQSSDARNFESRRQEELAISQVARKKLQFRNQNTDATGTITEDEARIRKITANLRTRPMPTENSENDLALSDDEDDDPDLAIPAEVPDWETVVSKEMAELIINNDLETKRQKVILELIHTEKLHLKSLKVLRKLFYKPFIRSRLFDMNFIYELFPNLLDLIKIHKSIIAAMEKRQAESEIVESIGDVIINKFSGKPGYELKEAYVVCYSNQSLTLAIFKEKLKDSKIEKFIRECESHPLCKHTSFQDLISSGCRRLMRYPLLLDQIAKYTQVDDPDFEGVVKALGCSKEVSMFVNSGIREAENYQTLISIVNNMDRSAIDQSNDPQLMEYKAIDFMKQRLLHSNDVKFKSPEGEEIRKLTEPSR
ncbi:uncharacterized protein TRIADDRAFT_54719 [Trichoplax adhaerens]|uniref:PDZ domain-containing protein n=1 Tax=Trichoplax adhaerens TaxID=10228 RepID=B3RST2_TRIAD|nr:hypothetical protein TRIADDRAFT_54719 [Trichoplax adhaerens]EDV27100.1 hypothetical protein TRIADDRAFT_54719 [Trichoplax adhaerens]|eukprot:XP_002111096.1 hypothetical protein TRIADDRAFT_54719 [Trichoplax adhaerens]